MNWPWDWLLRTFSPGARYYLNEVFNMATNGFLTREQILSAPDTTTREVDVPEWGGRVLVKSLTSKERAQYEESIMITRGKGRKRERDVDLLTAREQLVVRCVVDPDGNPLFEPGDVIALGKKSGAAMSRVSEVAMQLAGLSETDLEELEGNSSPPRHDSSVTD